MSAKFLYSPVKERDKAIRNYYYMARISSGEMTACDDWPRTLFDGKNSKWPPVKVVLIIYTFDEIKQMKEYALQKSTNTVLEQQTLLNCFEVRNHLLPIHYILFHEKKTTHYQPAVNHWQLSLGDSGLVLLKFWSAVYRSSSYC